MSDLKGKTAIVTGASSGIGEATAKLLAKTGVNVVITARRENRLKELKLSIESNGGEALSIPCDVTNKEEVYAVAEKTKANYGSIDILINNAGVMPLSYMKNLHVEEWEQMIDVNLKGVLYNIAAVLPVMREQKAGHIINVSSVAGRKLFPGAAVYCATKFGVTALSEGLRMELSPSDNIKVTAIEPGAVATELTHTITDEEITDGFLKQLSDLEMLESEDIADSIMYALTQPGRTNVSEILVMPTDQG